MLAWPQGTFARLLYGLIFFWGVSLLSLPVSAATAKWDRPDLVYVDFPPATFENSAGAPAGYLIRDLKTLFARIGLKPTYRLVPPARLFSELLQGQADGWLGIKVPKLQDSFLYSNKAIGEINLKLYRLSGTPEKSFEQLKKEDQVILIHGWSYGDRRATLEASSTVFDAPDTKAALSMLLLKRAPYLLSYQEVIETLKPSNVELLETDIRHMKIYFQLRKNFPNAGEIVEAFDQALKTQYPKDEP